MTTNSKNLREYADSARRAYYVVCDANIAYCDLDMYLVERRTYLAEYKLALTEAYELARTEAREKAKQHLPPLAPGTCKVLP